MGEEHLQARTILWAAGIKASPLNQEFEGELDTIGRLHVESDLSLAKYNNVFVIGDQAHFKQENGLAVPPLAPAAIQQGQFVAKAIINDLRGIPRGEFKYLDKGMMATIGRSAAIAQVGKIKLSGFLAWLAWCFVHILYLVGFRNKLMVMLQWGWSYFQFGRGARLITETEWRMFRPKHKQSSTQDTQKSDSVLNET